MIVCAKCNAKFPIELHKIGQDSTLPCINCGAPCLVKLFDLEKVQHHSDESYGGFSEISQPLIQSEDIKQLVDNDSTSIYKHLFIIVIILKILLVIFIIGILEIESLETKAPLLAEFYKKIHVFPRKTIVLSKVLIETHEISDGKMTMELNLEIDNISQKTELLSDVSIVIFDVFYNTISISDLQPYMMIKGDTHFNLKIKIPFVVNDAKYISIYTNGKTQYKKVNINKFLIPKKLLIDK